MAANAPANNSTISSTSPTSSFTSTTLPTDSSTTTSSSSDTSITTSSTSETTSTSASPTSSESLPTSSIESTTPTSATSASQVITTSTIISTPDDTTVIETSTSTPSVSTNPSSSTSSSATEAAASASSTTNPALASGSGSGDDGGLKQGPKIAIAVVVPVVVIALLIFAGLWFWKKRKQTKDAEDLRRKEMEEYGFNPNNDPTLPAVAGGGSTNGDETSTAREQDAGYRGWGGTTTASNTRKASTTMSSNPGMARSDSGGNGYKGQHSPTGNMTQISDGHSGDPLVGHGDETIGALGAAPAASGNRGVNRGPSNASSAYSAANRSDVSALSGDGPLPNGSPPYPQDYMYPDESNQHGWDGQPVIREVSARRNTRIENPSIVPQQGNAGIAQNF